MANEISEVLDKDLLSLSDKDLDVIIAYMRKMRLQADQGVKPKKTDVGEKINLTKLGLKKPIERTLDMEDL